MNIKCAFMQPHFFPWAGYFNLISKVDKFVFLDDVQYSKNSWQNRNYIIVDGKKFLINVPVVKSSLDTKIKDKVIDKQNNSKNRISKIIFQSYSKHKYYEDLSELMNYFLSLESKYLSDCNINIIKFVSSKLKIQTQFLCSSDLSLTETRTYKLIKILEKLNAKEYISPIGAKGYLTEDHFETLTDIKLHFHEFSGTNYSQMNQNAFIKNLSILDVVANLGWKNTEIYIKSSS